MTTGRDTTPQRLGDDELATIDEALADVARGFDYLLAVTPVNAAQAWEEFVASAYHAAPRFRYAPVTVDAMALREQLAALPVDAIDDLDLARLFAAKRQEVERWLSLLDLRGSPGFLPVSIDLYGEVDDGLLALAEDVLEAIPQDARMRDPGPYVDGSEFADLARQEVARYRKAYPPLPTKVEVRDDFPGVMVSGPDVIVGRFHRWAQVRAEALVHHEVGTHVVTNVNGAAQPLRLLEVGTPGYEATQEGLGVLAEHLSGGLTRARLALLAARVVAARYLTEGAPFAATFAELRDGVGLDDRRAFDVTMRTYRGGGLTKDALYLRGFARLLEHLAGGGRLEHLLVGKLDLADLPAVERLRGRGILRAPPLRPRWLDHPAAPPLLEAIRRAPSLPGIARALQV